MKVAVVGAGILGASVAYHLVRAGAEVVVADPVLDGRATAAGAGIICPWSSAVTDPVYNALAFAAARHYPELIAALAEEGENDTSYRRVGALTAPADEAGLDMQERIVRMRVADAPEAGAVSRLSPTEARALFPPLCEGRAALHIAGGARVDGRKMAHTLLAAARRRGATVHNGPATLTPGKEGVRGIRIDGQELDTDAVVVAGGAWADEALAAVGVRLGMQPQRGQIVHLHRAGMRTKDWPVLLPMTSHYLLAFDDERVVVGATRETGSGFDYRVTAGGLHDVLGNALQVAPGLADWTVKETRIGFRPAGPDSRPLLGRAAGIGGLFIANGLGAGGLNLGPFAGRQVAASVLGLSTDIDLGPFDPLRAAQAPRPSTRE